MKNDMSKLMREAMQIKARMDADKKRLAEINAAIADEVVFDGDCKTARLAMDGMMAKVQLRETVSWDQDALRAACKVIGADAFRKAFEYEFKPVSARALQSWLASPETPDEWRRLVTDARTIKTGAPSVSYEVVEEVM